MSGFHLTEYEFADVQRWVHDYAMSPIWKKRDAARLLVERAGDLHDRARTRALHQAQEETEFKRKTGP